MLDEYIWQSKHRPSRVYHAHMLVSKTTALFPYHTLPAHELRNELVEELIADGMSESGAEQDAPLVRGGIRIGMESHQGRK